MRLAAVVPTVDEQASLPATLARLRRVGVDDLVVADGGSTDATVDIARAAGARIVHAPTGRGPQLNAGAAAARGDVLFFVHADALPPVDARAHIVATLAHPGVAIGAFRTRTRSGDGRLRLGPLLRLADLRPRYTRVPYGDQCVFVRRHDFDAVGGFPDVPLMEDVGLSRRLRARGAVHTVACAAEVSGRRFETAPVSTFVVMNSFPLLHRLGVSEARLARLYAHVR